MAGSLSEQLCFGPFRLDQGNARLSRDGVRIALTPKALDVLHYLASHPDRLVSKEELLSSVWPDAIVGDASVKVCVREIRKALGDEAKVPTYIETVHRRGYRFIGRVDDPDKVPTSPLPVAPALPIPAPEFLTSVPHTIVGREAELERLRAQFDRAVRGHRQVLFVTGGPGSGKTALVEAFVEWARTSSCHSQSPPARILVGHCFEQFGTAEPYMPVWEAMSRLEREGGSSPTPATLSSVLARRAAAYASDLPLPASPPSPAPAPSAGAQPPSSTRMLREVADAIESLAASATVLLLLEDVHWADYSTLDLISALARRRTAARLMLLATYRPAEVLVEEHPLREIVQELRAASLCSELPLDFLDESGVRAYLAARFPSNEFPSALANRLQHRTSGHPLFLVHLVDDLIEQGVLIEQDGRWRVAGVESTGGIDDDGAWLAVLDTHIPQSVRAMIEVQLERLEPAQRQALETSAVAGVEFSAAAIAVGPVHGEDVVRAEQTCQELARGGRFLVARGLAEWPDGAVATHFRFAHELYHAAVYEHIPAARRAQLHRAIAQRLEAAWGDRAPEEAAELAMHFEQGRDWSRALKYLHHAAEAATRQYAHREAVHYLRRALAAAGRLPPAQRVEHELPLLMSLGVNLQVTRGCASPEVLQIYDRAEAACRSAGRGHDLRAVFPVLWGVWVFHKVRSDLPRADEMARRLLAMAREADDDALLLQAHQAVCVTSLCLGNPVAAFEQMQQAARLYDPAKHAQNTKVFGQDPGLATRAFGAVALWLLDRPEEALRASEAAVEQARRIAQPSTLALTLHFLAMVHQLRGDAAACGRTAQASIELSREEGFSFWLAGGRILRAWSRAVQGDPKAPEEIRSGIDAWLATGSRTYQTYYLGLLADALLRGGRFDEAMEVIARALEAADAIQEGLYLPQLLRLQSLGLRHRDPASSEAIHCLVRSIELSRRQGARMFERLATRDLADHMPSHRNGPARRNGRAGLKHPRHRARR